jgi:lambda repressor-like predicted transcriptional regulator
MDRAAELYAAGWTLRRIGAELGVDHSTVAHRLHRAGAKLRRGGPRRHDVDTQQILDLRDQGMSMAAIAAQVGMSVPGVWARYLRRAAGQDEIPITQRPGCGRVSRTDGEKPRGRPAGEPR